MHDEQLLRYSRHVMLDEISIEGQQRICQSRILVIGAGGLGSPALMYLAAAGCGQITLVDHDTVDLTNLQRQIAHTTEFLGRPKVLSAAHTLHEINPEVELRCEQKRMNLQTLMPLVQECDVVLDCTDHFDIRQQINMACVALGKPLVSGAAIRWDGQISVFDFRDDASPCYACIYPPEDKPQEVACSVMGVFAPLTGIIGTMQAAEALKLIAQVGEPLVGRLLLFNALDSRWRELKVRRQPECPVCGGRHLA